jgi:pilus assembly protein CpaC
VTAKKAGSTQIIVWDEQEHSQVIDVVVNFDVAMIRDEFKKQFPDAPITVDLLNGQLALKGRVGSLKVAEQAERVAKSYTPNVMNFLEVGGGQQIVLQVQFIEMSRAASNELGFRSYFTDGKTVIGTQNGPGADLFGTLAQNQKTTGIPASATLFGNASVGGAAFEYFLSAMKANSLARTLAEPNLVALSGEDADFLAGGEYPYPVPQSGAGGSSTITIQYKEFGVRLRYNAVVLGDGRIRMKINPEVSDLDYGASTSINGVAVPGLRTRKVTSIVEMAEGQTLALAGLLQRRVDSSRSGTPLLSDLPIVGTFFASTKYSRSETELVILVTPRLASALNPDQMPSAPGGNWRYPNEAQLYGLSDLGGPLPGDKPADNVPPPRFVGPNGFDDTAVQPTVAAADSK